MLPNYKSILYATDMTPNSEYTFKHAVMMARRSKADIYLLHVVPKIDAGFRSYVAAVMGEDNFKTFEDQHEEHALSELKKKLEVFAREKLADHPEDLKNIARIEVVYGHAVNQILSVSERLDVDVIVMGKHGKGALKHTFLGSVAEQVLHKSKKPVFVIPIPD